MRRIVLVLVVFCVTQSGNSQVQACGPFLGVQQNLTFRQEAAGAHIVAIVTLANPRLKGSADSGDGTTGLRVQTILKGEKELKGVGTIEHPRYMPIADPKNPPTYLIFCEVFREKLDTYRGVAVRKDGIIDYIKGAMALDPKDSVHFLSYFFDHLNDADPAIADDALLEFAKIDYRIVPAWAKKLPAEKLAGWLKRPNLSTARVRLYAALLGDCGADRDADLLRQLLDRARKQEQYDAIDGLLLGYTILRPKEGWAYLRDLLAQPESPAALRLAGIRVLRFLGGARQGLVSKEELVGGLVLLLAQGDFADIAIEQLRLWKCWEAAAEVLGCYGKKTHNIPIVRRAIIRYALSCPDDSKTKLFLAERRKVEPEMVKDVEESIAFEKTSPTDSSPRP